MADFDAIVVGSGMSGGWVAKELCERGLKVCVIERGKSTKPTEDYTDMMDPWDYPNLNKVSKSEEQEHYAIQHSIYNWSADTKHWWVKDSEHPYETADGTEYTWRRGYHVGGRSLMWARQSYRLSPIDILANKTDGHGVDWPIRYEDLAPWYDYVEEFAGISGQAEGLDILPDGKFLPVFEFTCGEEVARDRIEAKFPTRRMIHGRCANLRRATPEQQALGRGSCQVRNKCHKGCSFGAYFSSVSATLPAAERTGNLTLMTDQIVAELEHDADSNRVTGVRIIDRNTKATKTVTANIIFLNASAIASALILQNSKSADNPNGLANSSGMVGRNLMDHVGGAWGSGRIPMTPELAEKTTYGRRPNGFYIPRFRNHTEEGDGYVRGFGYQGGVHRGGWSGDKSGVGKDFKASNQTPGDWYISMGAFGEILPDERNRVMPHPTKTDKWGLPLPLFDARMRENEINLIKQASKDTVALLKAAGAVDIRSSEDYDVQPSRPGNAIHEMGTARMGRDPKTSVLNKYLQTHDIPNLFISDGSAMTSSACQNPSLTYMALSAKAANHAADFYEAGEI